MPSIDTGNNMRNLNTDGQGKRQKNEIAIRDIVTKLCPMEYNKLVAQLSADMHLAPDTVKYSFLSVLFNTDFICNDQYNVVYLKGTRKETEQPISKSINKCKNCDKSAPDNTDFCSENCKELYKHRNEKETPCETESLIEYANSKKNPHGETHQ